MKSWLPSITLFQTVMSKGLNIEKYSRRRIGDNKAKTTVDDILGILNLVDESGLLNHYRYFVWQTRHGCHK